MKQTKLILSALLLLAALGMTSCGGGASQPADTAQNDSSSAAADTEAPQAESQTDAPAADSQAAESETNFIDFGGIKIVYPASLVGQVTTINGVFRGDTEYCKDMLFMYRYDQFYTQEEGGIEKTPENVPEILRSQIVRTLADFYPCSEDTVIETPDSTETVEVLGAPFMLQTGKTVCGSGDTQTTLYYAGSYGIIDIPAYSLEQVPFAWIVYSPTDSDAARAELKSVIEEANSKAELT